MAPSFHLDNQNAVTVRIFAFLLLKGKILTHNVMQRRDLNCELGCTFCNDCTLETSMHLFFQCSYAVTYWNEIARLTGGHLMKPSDTVQNTYEFSARSRGTMRKKTWAVLFWAACWLLWKERNNRIFERKEKPPVLVAQRAVQEGFLWLKHC